MRSLSLLLLLPLSTAFAPAAFAPRRAVLRALPKDVITSDITEDIVNELLEEEVGSAGNEGILYGFFGALFDMGGR